jgi:seryl-tRNA synthetase
MLDIKLIRENPSMIRSNLEKRRDPAILKLFDELVEYDKLWREKKFETQELASAKNKISKEIGMLKKEGMDASEKLKELQDLPYKLKVAEEEVEKLKEKMDHALMRLPNILHESVPYGKDDTENELVRTFGETPKKDFPLKNHIDIIESFSKKGFERSAKISGSGWYFLKGDMALLSEALMSFAIKKLVSKGYSLVEVPHMMNRKSYEGVTDLADFESVMYKIENEDLYMIATSEHPLTAMFMDETLTDLPIKLCGNSYCFRKEVGAHGIDEKGLFRRHQFRKIEQVVICDPAESWKYHEEMIANAEELFKELGLSYRVVNICTGDIGIVASKKFDIEAWMPRTEEYKEVVSCSNCTDYQARRLKIRFGKEGGDKQIAHTLNSTGVAIGRAMVAILENYQNEDGSITVPEVLRAFIGKDVIKP